MQDSKNLIPEIYSTSYDMSIFTGLINLVFGAREPDLITLSSIHSSNDCRSDLVERLATLFNLKTANRELIANYRLLIKNKGTEQSIKDLALLCGAKSILEDSNNLSLRKEEGSQNTFLLETDVSEMDSELFYNLLKRISPVNITIKIVPPQPDI